MESCKEIFIIGISRTGSKFYMQLLNSNKDFYIAPEMIFKHPFKKDLFNVIKRGLVKYRHELSDFVDYILNSNLKDTSRKTLHLIHKDILVDVLKEENELSPYKVFKLIIEQAAAMNKKKIAGAKFPVHYNYLNELHQHFPQSKILFLTRDPREIYLSDAKKKRKELSQNKSAFPIKGLFFIPAVCFYTIYEWKRSLKKYEKTLKHIGKEKIRLFKYESILSNQNEVIDVISSFLDVPPENFSDENISVMDSSFNKKPELGRWKHEMNYWEQKVFKLFIGKRMKNYGYD